MAWQFHGNYGGPGFSNGHITVPGERVDPLGRTTDIGMSNFAGKYQ